MRGQRGDQRAPRVRFNSRLAVAISIFIVTALCIALFVTRQVEIVRRRQLVATLSWQREAALAEQDQLRDRLASADDLAAIELQARERLGLVLPGEEKIIFVEEE